MPTLAVYDMQNNKVGDVELSDEIFGVEVNAALLHQAVVRELANRRLGTHATKTRAMVRGGGRKPWRQKGTGRARSGSRRSPLWRGGGTVFGPHPRSYAFTMPRKQRRLALKCALSDKVQTGDLLVLDKIELAAPKTKEVVKLLQAFDAERKALIITAAAAEDVERSARNIPDVKAVSAAGISVYDILNSNKLLMTRDAAQRIEEVFA